MAEDKKRKRVKLSLVKERGTADGEVLEYLHLRHPGRRSGNEVGMNTLSQHWLPLVLKSKGVTKEEYQRAGAYSVRQLLAQVCWIIDECELPPLSLQAVLGGFSTREGVPQLEKNGFGDTRCKSVSKGESRGDSVGVSSLGGENLSATDIQAQALHSASFFTGVVSTSELVASPGVSIESSPVQLPVSVVLKEGEDSDDDDDFFNDDEDDPIVSAEIEVDAGFRLE